MMVDKRKQTQLSRPNHYLFFQDLSEDQVANYRALIKANEAKPPGDHIMSMWQSPELSPGALGNIPRWNEPRPPPSLSVSFPSSLNSQESSLSGTNTHVAPAHTPSVLCSAPYQTHSFLQDSSEVTFQRDAKPWFPSVQINLRISVGHGRKHTLMCSEINKLIKWKIITFVAEGAQ